jgi:hypothetical protein
LTCRWAVLGMTTSKSWYLWFFGFILGRTLSEAEAEEVWSKVTWRGPIPYEETWGAVFERVEQHRREHPDFNFWRSQV